MGENDDKHAEMAKSMSYRSWRVELLIYDGCLGSEIFAVFDVLRMANALAARGRRSSDPPFDIAIVAVSTRKRRLSGGIEIVPSASCMPHVLVVPGVEFHDMEDLLGRVEGLSRETGFLRRAQASGTRLASICVGAFVLASAGLLDGRRATTAWLAADTLKRRWPTIKIDPDLTLVTDGSITTGGAVTAAYDLALLLVEQHLGLELAASLRKIILLDVDRRQQTPFVLQDFIEAPKHSHPIGKAKQWLRRNIAEAYDLKSLAAASGLSVRTLLRRFRREVGMAPHQFHHQLKIERARHLLETTTLKVAQIPQEIGYSDEVAFRMLFKRVTGMTPTSYRRKFGLLAAHGDPKHR